ncbi:MAG: thermonuclease family protein, partial [Verrucomicrobiales bacterium]|nr:thermonuclease family protein [Verrucomicrobiales bacterium]
MANLDLQQPVVHTTGARRVRARGAIVQVWILAVLICGGLPVCRGQQQRQPGSGEAKWETLEGCRLVPGAFLDGDSFHALHNDREYAFRLYFVDAPETDPMLADRVREQAVYFGLSPGDIPRGAKLAADFTRELLGTNTFTVLTRWHNAMGRGRLARFYAVVLVNQTNLAEALVANGLARIHGLRANWPGGPRSS